MRAPLWPYKVLVSLLYGRYTWIVRHPGGSLTVPTAKFADALNLRGDKLKVQVDFLNLAGFFDLCQWHSDFFVVRVKPPHGWGRTIDRTEEVVDVGPT